LHDVLPSTFNMRSLECLVYFMWQPIPGYRSTLVDFTLYDDKFLELWWGLWKDRGTYFTEVFKEKVKRVLPAGSIYMQRSAARGIGNDEYA
jgi:hypothetical protein